MIVVNLPFYVPIRTKQNRITLARDNISDAINLYINYDNSLVYPTKYFYSTDGSTWNEGSNIINSPADLSTATSFPLKPSTYTKPNPREAFNQNSDGTSWKLNMKNYVVIDRYGDVEHSDGKLYFEHKEGGTTYRYRIDDGTWVNIQSNIVTSDGKYVGAHRFAAQIINLDNYEQTYVDSSTGETVPYKSALIFSPKHLPFVKYDETSGQYIIQDPLTYKYIVKQFAENESVLYSDTEREHWAVKAALPMGMSGMFGQHILTRDYNILIKLNWTSFDSSSDDWDLAILRLTKVDDIEIPVDRTSGHVGQNNPYDSSPINMLESSTELPDGSQNPVIYVSHKDENGKVIGMTRLGFINEVTEIVVKKHIDPSTGNPIYDDVYIACGTTRKFVDIGFCDIRFYKKKSE